jgi:hypothetical protein
LGSGENYTKVLEPLGTNSRLRRVHRVQQSMRGSFRTVRCGESNSAVTACMNSYADRSRGARRSGAKHMNVSRKGLPMPLVTAPFCRYWLAPGLCAAALAAAPPPA